MKTILPVLAVALLGGCSSRPPFPEAELDAWIAVDRGGPIDPASVLMTLHADGRASRSGRARTAEDLVVLVGGKRNADRVNRTPVLFEVDPKAGFAVVRDVITMLTGKAQCVNYAFLVATPSGPGAVVLPMPAEKGPGILVYEGRSGEKRIGEDWRLEVLEVVVTSGEGGSTRVVEVNHLVPGSEPPIYFPPAGEKVDNRPKSPPYPWKGEHPPFGDWNRATLETFLTRPDVAALSPYVTLKVTVQDPAADVIRCLSTLRSLGNVPIVPDIPTGW